jgi:hypothetical protein
MDPGQRQEPRGRHTFPPQTQTPEHDPEPHLQPRDDKGTVGPQVEPHISHPHTPPTLHVIHPGVEDIADEQQLMASHGHRLLRRCPGASPNAHCVGSH